MRKRDGSTLTYSYDALNRVTVRTVTPSGTRLPSQALTAAQTRPVHYAYNIQNLQTEARFDSLSGEGISNAYDGFGRLVSSTTNMGGTARTLTRSYDVNGWTILTHPDGTAFTTMFDALGRLHSLSAPDGWRVLPAYTPQGALYGNLRANGVNDFWAYDPAQRPWSHGQYFPSSPGSDTIWFFTHNPANQIASITRTNDLYAWTSHYGVQRPYQTNGLNQYSQTGSGAGQATFGYDANGNLITQAAGGVTKTYTYDVENRLVGASGGVVLSYDPLGRLYRVSSPTTDTRFLYDGDALVAEYDAAGAMTRRYVHGPGADVPLLSYEGSGLGQLSYLHADHQGSIVALSNSSGAATAINSYDEYGIPAAGNTGRFQYTGQIWLPELGMYHYKARVYSPTLGRFLQTDPVGYQDQYNLYAYVGNDPVNSSDPTGNTVAAICETRGTSCPGGTPTPGKNFQEVEPNFGGVSRRGVPIPERSPGDTIREAAYEQAIAEVRRYDPGYEEMSEPGRVPSDASIAYLQNLGNDLARTQNFFRSRLIDIEPHAMRSLVARGPRGITNETALRAYNRGRTFYDPSSRNYIRRDSQSGVYVVISRLRAGSIVTVAEGPISPRWNPVPYR